MSIATLISISVSDTLWSASQHLELRLHRCQEAALGLTSPCCCLLLHPTQCNFKCQRVILGTCSSVLTSRLCACFIHMCHAGLVLFYITSTGVRLYVGLVRAARGRLQWKFYSLALITFVFSVNFQFNSEPFKEKPPLTEAIKCFCFLEK